MKYGGVNSTITLDGILLRSFSPVEVFASVVSESTKCIIGRSCNLYVNICFISRGSPFGFFGRLLFIQSCLNTVCVHQQ